MALIRPFPALRFQPHTVQLEQVLTQPYDKITAAMQARYYGSGPHNLIRYELGRTEPGDDDRHNIYTRARQFLQELQNQGILAMEKAPAFYVYAQRFAAPGQDSALERTGFIGLCRLRDYSDEVVYRHEATMARPKADRLNLLRATKVHSGSIFMLYSDPEHAIDTMLASIKTNVPPIADLIDEFQVEHRLWKTSDRREVETLQAAMAEKKLLIADGHHRYETALAYRNERRAAGLTELAEEGRTGQMKIQTDAGYEFVMATFVNMDDPGLVILPTHRVISRLRDFNAERMFSEAAAYFTIEPLPEGTDLETARAQLRAALPATTVLAAVAGGMTLLHANPAAMEKALPGLSPRQRALDVVQLHRLLLHKVLRISEDEMRDQQYLSYHRDAAEAIAMVQQGADAAFLLNSIRMGQMRDVAFAGEVLPQKSTDFYPKLLSGLTLYAVE